MGYGAGAIGLSYIPQTIAFLIGGYGCRSALKKWPGPHMLPWLLLAFALSVAGTWAMGVLATPRLALLMVPFCLMAMANGAIYPIVVAAALQNTLQLGLCFPANLLVSSLVTWPLAATTGVMLITVVLVALAGGSSDNTSYRQHSRKNKPTYLFRLTCTKRID